MQLAAIDTITEDFPSIVEVPATRASIDTIGECSHTYDAYGVHGSLEPDVGVEWELGEAINEASAGLVRSR